MPGGFRLPTPPSCPRPAQPIRQQSTSSADKQSTYYALDLLRLVNIITLHPGRSSLSRSVNSMQSHSVANNEILAHLAEVCLQEQSTTELETKFQKFSDTKNWMWWIAQLQAHGLRPTWQGCFSSLGTYPLVTTPATLDILQCLYQRLVQAINENTGLILMGRQQEFQGKGLELLQAIYDQYQPNDVVTLPLVFTDWSQLAQQANEESFKFTGRVRELALQSKNSSQPYTEASQCLAFLHGLNYNYNQFY